MKKALLFLITLWLCTEAYAQHEGHTKKPETGKAKAKPADAVKKEAKPDSAGMMRMPDDSIMKMSDMDMGDEMAGMDGTMMSHQLSRNLPMNRNGSGTSWLPDNTPVYAYMQHAKMADAWKLMYMGNIYLRYTNQDFTRQGSRGGAQFDAPNWLMVMTQKNIGKKGLFAINGMFSLDPFAVTPGGYPLLFQSGESYQGKPLVDAQHPHDLFANLSVSYAHSFTKDIDLFGLVGYPAEPVIGPPVFMHRISAFNLPDAPIGHHWQDATHISFGVATLGLRYQQVKVEASAFKGREPDEFRYNFDRLAIDSWAWRLSWNPTKSLALQFSQGDIHSPENLHPEENVFRQTASVIHTKPIGKSGYIATTVVWGLNQKSGDGKSSNDHSALIESNLQLQKWAFFGRYEWVQKLPEELLLDLDADKKLQFSALALGTNRIIYTAFGTDLRIGAVFTINLPDAAVTDLYGNLPLAGQIYVKITPALMVMK